MAIRTVRFKPDVDAATGKSPCHAAVSLQSYRLPRQETGEPQARSNAMIDQQIDISTRDGHTTTFITHPERGGPHPVIIFYMDAPAIREELRDMARGLGTSGYYVMLPNLYYRSGVMELGPIPPDPEAPERKRMFGYMNSIDIPMVMEDTKALLAYADGQPAARANIVGSVGYCMSGRYAINAATHFPDRVRAAASIPPGPRSRSIPAPITASRFRSGRSMTATRLSGTGNGCWHFTAASSRHKAAR
jgi:dienelactone hydrolase